MVFFAYHISQIFTEAYDCNNRKCNPNFTEFEACIMNLV